MTLLAVASRVTAHDSWNQLVCEDSCVEHGVNYNVGTADLYEQICDYSNRDDCICECQQLCQLYYGETGVECDAFTYVERWHKCYLKEVVEGNVIAKEDEPGAHSGLKTCDAEPPYECNNKCYKLRREQLNYDQHVATLPEGYRLCHLPTAADAQCVEDLMTEHNLLDESFYIGLEQKDNMGTDVTFSDFYWVNPDGTYEGQNTLEEEWNGCEPNNYRGSYEKHVIMNHHYANRWGSGCEDPTERFGWNDADFDSLVGACLELVDCGETTDPPTTLPPTLAPTTVPPTAPPAIGCQTGWGYPQLVNGVEAGEGDYYPFGTDELDDITRWGWTHGSFKLNEFVSLNLQIYAAAAQNDITKGYYVGDVVVNNLVSLGGDLYQISVSVETLGSWYEMDDLHLYAGSTPLPLKGNGKFTAAPGSFDVVENFGTRVMTYDYDMTFEIPSDVDSFWFAIHSTVCDA